MLLQTVVACKVFSFGLCRMKYDTILHNVHISTNHR